MTSDLNIHESRQLFAVGFFDKSSWSRLLPSNHSLLEVFSDNMVLKPLLYKGTRIDQSEWL